MLHNGVRGSVCRGVAALAFVMLLSSCSSSPGAAGNASPSAAQSTTAIAPPTPTKAPTPTPTEAAALAAAPKLIYAGTATCSNLLDATRVAKYLASGSTVTSDSWGRKIRNEDELHSSPFGLASFISRGGIACGWGDGYENQIIFGYGPISAADATEARAWLLKHKYSKAKGSPFERYDSDSGSYAFGTGYWATASDNGDGNVLAEVVAHAPRWLHAGNDTKPTPTKLSERAARPAAAPYLTTDGLGQLRLGSVIPADNPFVAFQPKACYGAWLAKGKYGNAQLDTQALDVLTSAHKSGARLTGILLRDDTIPTKSGIRVGDSLATLTATFDKFDDTIPFVESTGYVIGDSHGKVVFDVASADSPTGSYLAGQIRAISLFPAAAHGTELSADNWAPCTL